MGNGLVTGPAGSVPIAEVARTWYLRPQDLPNDVAPGGLEVTAGYKPLRDSGTFSYAAHAAVVSVDTELGDIRILDYAICEDGGTLVNPMIVDGQVIGGTAQGIGTALYEEMPFDDAGQPLGSTLADYLLPGATEVPEPRIEHMQTPSPLSMFGQKGIGEGGAIGPPAAIANAVNDALAPFGVEMTELPITPRRVLAALLARGNEGRSVRACAPGESGRGDLAAGSASGYGARAGRRAVAGADAEPAPGAAASAGAGGSIAGARWCCRRCRCGNDRRLRDACVDRRWQVPDIGGNVLARVADNIAYRAVRNRGTIGGSLCHADPAADWVTVLTALDAVACCTAQAVRAACAWRTSFRAHSARHCCRERYCSRCACRVCHPMRAGAM